MDEPVIFIFDTENEGRTLQHEITQFPIMATR